MVSRERSTPEQTVQPSGDRIAPGHADQQQHSGLRTEHNAGKEGGVCGAVGQVFTTTAAAKA